MSDWGVSKGLAALYGETGKRQSSKEEYAILGMMDQRRVAQEKEDQVARKEQEAYYDKVSEFSATLLAPDRNRINDKAKVLSKKVREHVQLYGGDMSKFMANGGGQLMRDYKNTLLNSTEASQYADNKKNMDMIIKAQMAGKTLNPTDLQNLHYYKKNGKGNITYTGLLTDIDMPNAKAYPMGSKIPSIDILKNKDNYMKIFGNYITTYPNLPRPTEQDLLNFVNYQYSGIGENYQAANARVRAANSKAKKDEEYKYKVTGEIANTMKQIPPDLTARDLTDNYWNENGRDKLINPLSEQSYDAYAYDFALEGKGFFDVGREGVRRATGMYNLGPFKAVGASEGLEKWFAEEYSVRGARRLYERQEMQFVAAYMGIEKDSDQLNFTNKKIKNWQPDDDSFTPSGQRAGDLKDPLEYDDYKGEWKVNAVITGFYGKTNNGVEQMVMNTIDSGKVDKTKTDDWNEKTLGDSVLKQGTYIVLEDDKNNVFYQKVNMDDPNFVSSISESMGIADDFGGAIKNDQWIQKKQAYADQIVKLQSQPINEFYNRILSNEQANVNVKSELLNFSPDGNYNDTRKNLLQSFYTALSALGGENTDETYLTESGVNKFTTAIQMASQESGKDYISMLKNQEMTDTDIISIMMRNDPEQADLYTNWLANYKVLSNR